MSQPLARNSVALFALLLIGLALAGAGWLLLSDPERPTLPPEVAATRPDFTLTDLNGVERHSSEWQGKVVLLNFWATWCPPCRHEMPHFAAMQKEYGDQGFEVVAIATDDEALVRNFAEIHGLNFTILLGDMRSMSIARQLGNRFDAMPYSAIFDRNGKTRMVHAGGLNRRQLEAVILPILSEG